MLLFWKALGVLLKLLCEDRRQRASTYFRTQMTRTTDALASDDPPAAFTPLALRNSRTVSDDTSAACAAGAASLYGPRLWPLLEPLARYGCKRIFFPSAQLATVRAAVQVV